MDLVCLSPDEDAQNVDLYNETRRKAMARVTDLAQDHVRGVNDPEELDTIDLLSDHYHLEPGEDVDSHRLPRAWTQPNLTGGEENETYVIDTDLMGTVAIFAVSLRAAEPITAEVTVRDATKGCIDRFNVERLGGPHVVGLLDDPIFVGAGVEATRHRTSGFRDNWSICQYAKEDGNGSLILHGVAGEKLGTTRANG